MIYCLDTDILIEYFRGNEKVKNRIKGLSGGDGIGLTWLSFYEFFKGIFVSGKTEEEKFQRTGWLDYIRFSYFWKNERHPNKRLSFRWAQPTLHLRSSLLAQNEACTEQDVDLTTDIRNIVGVFVCC